MNFKSLKVLSGMNLSTSATSWTKPVLPLTTLVTHVQPVACQLSLTSTVTWDNLCIEATKFRNSLNTQTMSKPVTYCFMENSLPNLNTPSLSKLSLMKWFLTKEWFNFTKDSSQKHIPWQLWLESSAHSQPFCIQTTTSTSKRTDTNWPSSSLPKCPP